MKNNKTHFGKKAFPVMLLVLCAALAFSACTTTTPTPTPTVEPTLEPTAEPTTEPTTTPAPTAAPSAAATVTPVPNNNNGSNTPKTGSDYIAVIFSISLLTVSGAAIAALVLLSKKRGKHVAK